jgi:ribosomal protein L11 methyltransferase
MTNISRSGRHTVPLSVPYRVDLHNAGVDAPDTIDALVALGALDIDSPRQDSIAVLMPDRVTPAQVAAVLGVEPGALSVSPATGRDDGSVWILRSGPVHIGRLSIVPAHAEAEPGALRLVDANAFGSGLHPTTRLCLEILEEEVVLAPPAAVLDVGTGSGILALAALMLGVPRASGLDIDDEALAVATENARLNGIETRLQLTRGGPDAVAGTWPLVLANVLPAPLIEMAPALVKRIGHQGLLVLSGIPASVERDVAGAYRRLGMHYVRTKSRSGWAAVIMRASW